VASGMFRGQLGLPIASTAPLATISDRFTRAVQRSQAEGMPLVDFRQGSSQGRCAARAP